MKLIAHARRLEVLLAVADCGSFSAAGSTLVMTQSGVSQHVLALEREAGTMLVERGTRPLALTEAGHALARHARAVVARLDNAEQELMEITAKREPEGCVSAASPPRWPPSSPQSSVPSDATHPEVA